MSIDIKRNQQVEKMITAISLIVIGILFCVNLAAKVISIVIGSVFIVLGALLLIILISKKESLLTFSGIIGGFYITIGISLIVINFIGLLISLTPYLLIVFGSIMLIDAIIIIASKKQAKVFFIMELVLAVIFLTIGILLLVLDSFRAHVAIMFGVLLIACGIYSLVKILLKKGKE